MSKQKYVNVGILCRRKDGDGFYIKLDREIDVKIDGDTVTGGYLNVNSPLDKFDKMAAKAERDLEEGKINEDEYTEKIEKAQEQAARFDKGGDLEYISKELQYVRKD